jgi:hypothetical protein
VSFVARALVLVGALSIAGCGSSGSGNSSSALTLPPLGSAVATTAVGGATTASGGSVAAGATTTTKAGSTTTTVKAASTSTAKKAANPDPCTLVSKTQAEDLAGTALEVGITSGQAEDQSCTYPGVSSGPTAQVELFVGDGAKKYLEVDRSLQHDISPVAGLGDEAYVEEFTVFARKGQKWIALRLVRLNDFEPYRQPMLDLATDILKQL